MYATYFGERITASKGLIATCPLCKSKVIAKCGMIKVWHWAHESIKDCDDWYESETLWHRNWKNIFPTESREVIIENHRADIFYNGWIIELQNSTISPEDIIERERFYTSIANVKGMIWIINGKEFTNNFDLRHKEQNCYTFRWKHPRQSWFKSTQKIYFDNFFEDRHQELFFLKKLYPNTPCGGYGFKVSKKSLLNYIKSSR